MLGAVGGDHARLQAGPVLVPGRPALLDGRPALVGCRVREPVDEPLPERLATGVIERPDRFVEEEVDAAVALSLQLGSGADDRGRGRGEGWTFPGFGGIGGIGGIGGMGGIGWPNGQ